MSLSRKTSVGVFWNFVERIGRRSISVTVTLILAYFLTPEDFGLIAMMAIFLALGSSLMDSGFKQALIRMTAVNQVDFSTAFFANVLLGLISYSLLYFFAPLISVFYNEPRLVSLIRITSIIIVINSFQVVQSAVLSRSLNFKLQFKISLPAILLSSVVAVVAAYHEYGVWVLVLQMIVYSFITTILLWYHQAWRTDFIFSYDSFSKMYNFGYKIFLTGTLDILFKNLYVIVIAKMFSASTAGLYFFSEKIKDLIVNQLVATIQNVTYPALASIQEDSLRLKSGYRKVISIMTFILTPVLLLLAVLAESVFTAFLPDRWLPAVPYLQLMCIAVLMTPLNSINSNILKVKGRSDLLLYLEIIKKIIAGTILFISVQFGIIGILVGQILASVLIYIPNSYYSKKLIGYSVREQIADFFPAFILAVITSGLVAIGMKWFDASSLVELIVFGFIGFFIYLGSALYFNLTAVRLVKKLWDERKVNAARLKNI